jgi:excisionase family DNA binding protein
MPKLNEEVSQMLTVEDVAAKLSVRRRIIDYAIQQGSIVAVRIGNRPRIAHAELERIMREGLPSRKAA